MHPALIPARQAGTQFIYLRGMEEWAELGGWLYTKMACLSAVSHPGGKHLIATWPWPGVELEIF